MNSNVPESAALALEEYEAHYAGPECDFDGVARYLERRVVNKVGCLEPHESRAMAFFEDVLGDEIGSKAQELGTLALNDPSEAAWKLTHITQEVIQSLAITMYDEFENDAREWGYVE